MDAGGDGNIADLGKLYRDLGKAVYAVCDKQDPPTRASIEAHVDKLFMHDETDIEKLVLNNTTREAMNRFIDAVQLPPHLTAKYQTPKAQAFDVITSFLGWSKGNWGLAEFLSQCEVAEIPEWIRETCRELRELCQPPASDADEADALPGPEDPAEDGADRV